MEGTRRKITDDKDLCGLFAAQGLSTPQPIAHHAKYDLNRDATTAMAYVRDGYDMPQSGEYFRLH